ncbi:asparagine synthase-related protein [Embleya hyalina]|uniref:Asparagine synthase n=1 Tax=Embleya hyalina TaxID=516124 RepID=A0A401YEZ5_9ACTN|nr:asparagine synthase-related protein [Embleya hyalina]GCD93181.1 asparagine synthase [Embleya hyalina]
MNPSSATAPGRARPAEVAVAPGFVVAIRERPARSPAEPPADPASLGLPGTAVWSALPGLRVYGAWRPGQVRSAVYRDVRMVVLGHCLASDDRLARELRDMIEREGIRADGIDGGEGRVGRGLDLPGAYVCVVAARDGVRIRSDLAGQYPVFVSRADGWAVAASHARLLARLHDREPDAVTAAARIACAHVPPLWADRSPFHDVARVTGGAVLRLRPGAPPVVGRTGTLFGIDPLARGAHTLRDALTEAVAARRAAGAVASDFSGGLDSTTLAFLAARAGHGPVSAVTYHHPDAPAGDLAHARRLARLDDRLRHIVVEGRHDTLPFDRDAARSQPTHTAPVWRTDDDEPVPGMLARGRSLLRLAAVGPLDSHLTGEGGDAVLGAPPAYLAHVASRGHARTFARHCLAQARRHDTSAAALAARALRTARTSGSEALVHLAAALRSGTIADGPTSWIDGVTWWPPVGEAVSWLTPATRRALADRAERVACDGTHHLDGAAAAVHVAGAGELRHSADAQRHLRELGHRYGVDVHAPFLDDRVVRACLAVAPGERVDPAGGKPLLAAALRGTVPSAVLGRRTKGDYSREEYLGARRAEPWLRALWADSALADAGIVEPAAVLRSLARFTAGVAVPLGAIRQLVATEVWLRARREEGS